VVALVVVLEHHLPVGLDLVLDPARRAELGQGIAAQPFGHGAELRTGASLTYEVRANYKVLLENYNECYHCGPVHPELSRLVPSFAGGGSGLDWEDGIPHREGAWTFTMSGTTTRSPLPGLTDAERTRHKGELAYPNLLLSASADHVAAFVLAPRGVDRTDIVCSLLFAADEVSQDGFAPGDAVELWDLVNRQDWSICESVQRGMSSRSYRHGWFAPMEDDSLDIRRWLLPLLED
jgi:Rieske 2Fe-2S family protein